MLERLEHWARTAPDRTYLTQPLPNGSVVEYSWARVWDESRRMAAHLHSLGLPPAAASRSTARTARIGSWRISRSGSRVM